MAYDINTTLHGVFFPSKILGGNGGEHILDMVCQANYDNGAIVGVGQYVSFDNYKTAAAGNTFAGKIVDQAANGNWYVQIDVPADCVVIYDSEILPRTDRDLSRLAMFYNKKDDVVKGMMLHKYDIGEFSSACFTTTPTTASIGKTVTANATTGKLVIGN